MPNCVVPGWDRAVPVAPYALLFYADGRIAFEHICDRGDRGVIKCAPRLQISEGGHRLVSIDPVTVEPSILCSDCGTHGFVHAGQWVAA